jgi:very-short-patch-repair endonuclease
LKQFKDTNIHYQGSYELDFLEHYYDKLNIKRSKSIKYKINESNHIYFPDFYIPELNLIIEIKNSYLAKRDKLKLSAKKYAVLKKGFNFIMIIDKDYSSFETILKHESINTKYS